MTKWIIAVALIVAIIATYPLIATMFSDLFIPKWSNIPIEKRATLYLESSKVVKVVNYWIGILLKIGGILVVILTIIEYYKFWKLYKEERV
ncbi:MAG TPA: hypothetical protein EYG81_05280 [Archaeoglobus profundus]|nr:hypothetical protein [Archaeoglobus profundus]HIP58448.1 hypothetical protein [Archaeoglobus profundus]